MLDIPQTTMEAICQAIGYQNTRVLQAWYAGRNLYIPAYATDDHPLARLISFAALKMLVARLGQRLVFVPSPAEDYRYFLERQMAHRIATGASDDELAAQFNFTKMRVMQLRCELTENGWVEYTKAMPDPRPPAGRNKGIEQRLVKNF